MPNRYARQQQVPQLGIESQPLLAQARVLVVGVGGLGSPVCQFLVGAGVGQITLIDSDTVDISNLHRQTLFCETDVGQLKARVAQRKLTAVNRDVNVIALTEDIGPDNVAEYVQQHTVVVDAADSFFTSYLLSDVCFEHRIPLVSASVLQTSGYVGVFCGTASRPAPSMRAVFPVPPLHTANCSAAGVTGPSVGVIGAIQAQEVLKVIVSAPAQLLGELLHMELWSYQQHRVNFGQAAEPEIYAALVSRASTPEGVCLLDVRSEQEAQHNRGTEITLNIPVEQLKERYKELDKHRPTVCVCHSGQRALNAANQLLQLGFEDVKVAL